MLPMRGYPFGPGGYGGLFLIFCHFQARAEDAAAQSKATTRVLSSVISRDKLGRGSESGESPIPSDRPQIYIRSVSGNVKEQCRMPGGLVLMNAKRRELLKASACGHADVLIGLNTVPVSHVSLSLSLRVNGAT